MTDKSTDELNKLLRSTRAKDMGKFLEENRDSFLREQGDFTSFLKGIMKKNSILEQEVFLLADIPERYGYKLLSGEKRTKRRDVILRICYAAGLSLQETQKALKLYGLPELFVRVPRDAALMICFNERPGSVPDVNAFLKQHGMEPLRSSGSQS